MFSSGSIYLSKAGCFLGFGVISVRPFNSSCTPKVFTALPKYIGVKFPARYDSLLKGLHKPLTISTCSLSSFNASLGNFSSKALSFIPFKVSIISGFLFLSVLLIKIN